MDASRRDVLLGTLAAPFATQGNDMLTGSLTPCTNQEDCKIVVATEDVTTGDFFDLTGATIVCQIRDPDTRQTLLSATTANGKITQPDSGSLQVWFTLADMQTLPEGQYDIGAVVTLNGETKQIILGVLPVMDGVVTQ